MGAREFGACLQPLIQLLAQNSQHIEPDSSSRPACSSSQLSRYKQPVWYGFGSKPAVAQNSQSCHGVSQAAQLT